MAYDGKLQYTRSTYKIQVEHSYGYVVHYCTRKTCIVDTCMYSTSYIYIRVYISLVCTIYVHLFRCNHLPTCITMENTKNRLRDNELYLQCTVELRSTTPKITRICFPSLSIIYFSYNGKYMIYVPYILYILYIYCIQCCTVSMYMTVSNMNTFVMRSV